MDVHKWAFFEKYIIFDFGKNGPNEAHRTTNDVVQVLAKWAHGHDLCWLEHA